MITIQVKCVSKDVAKHTLNNLIGIVDGGIDSDVPVQTAIRQSIAKTCTLGMLEC